jgi:hypothetical protein
MLLCWHYPSSHEPICNQHSFQKSIYKSLSSRVTRPTSVVSMLHWGQQTCRSVAGGQHAAWRGAGRMQRCRHRTGFVHGVTWSSLPGLLHPRMRMQADADTAREEPGSCYQLCCFNRSANQSKPSNSPSPLMAEVLNIDQSLFLMSCRFSCSATSASVRAPGISCRTQSVMAAGQERGRAQQAAPACWHTRE